MMNYGLISKYVSVKKICESVDRWDVLVPIFIQRLTFCTSLEILPLMEIPGIKRVNSLDHCHLW